MGKFVYDSNISATIEDRALAHLQSVIASKLRRGESFLFSWKEDVGVGSGRTSVWVHSAASIAFKYSGSRTPPLSREWLQALSYTASSPNGLYLVPEPPKDGVDPLGEKKPMTFRVAEESPRVGLDQPISAS